MPAFSHDVALADDIVAELNARSWSQPFVAIRTWVPRWSVRGAELAELQVAVNPWIDPTLEQRERGEMWSEWPIDITIAQQLTTKTRAAVDALADLVEELRRFLCPQAFDLGDGRLFVSRTCEYLARFDPSQLQRQTVSGSEVYTGHFLSAFRIPFELLLEDPEAATVSP